MSVDVQDMPATRSGAAAPGPRSGLLTALFATTSLVGAGLLFVVQPMIARLVLPSYGGSASVWSTSSLLFQVVLLLGYVYAHASTQRLGPRRQPLLHLAILLLPLMALPVVLPSDAAPSADASPVLWLLRTLLLTIGLPFAVIATTGPLLQRWYSWTAGRRSEDPYFLFAASNLGSFGGLLAYPFLVEPFLTLEQQRHAWSWGFVVFMVLMSACGIIARRGQPSPADPQRRDAGPRSAVAAVAARPSRRLMLQWLALSFLPSTLMLGVTSHISTDIAAIPLMWVVPLAIYLATFVLAFARTSRELSPGVTGSAVFMAALAGLVYLVGRDGIPLWLALLTDLLLLSTAAYAAHARLATTRPDPAHLTRFYLVVAAGGALGGLLNGMVAPVFFNAVWEYPIALLGVLALGLGRSRPLRFMARFQPRAVVVVEAVLLTMLVFYSALGGVGLMHRGTLAVVAGLTLWVVVAYLGSRRPGPMAAALAVSILGFALLGPSAIYQSRTFYGSYSVLDGGTYRQFLHGTTVHGLQLNGDRSTEPTSYYSRSGPMGDAFSLPGDPPGDVGVVGLGVGTLAAYVGAGQAMTFFEIDPEVARVAEDPNLFTYLSDSQAAVDVVVGDGRLKLAGVEDEAFDTLVLDAFSSDAIPVHLLTHEAFDGYARVLAEDGLLMVHITNRILNLEPVVASAADHLGWSVAVGEGGGVVEASTRSRWVALSSDRAKIDALLARPAWRRAGTERRAWTDDFSSVLTTLR